MNTTLKIILKSILITLIVYLIGTNVFATKESL